MGKDELVLVQNKREATVLAFPKRDPESVSGEIVYLRALLKSHVIQLSDHARKLRTIQEEYRRLRRRLLGLRGIDGQGTDSGDTKG